MGRGFYESLSEPDLLEIYEEHQKEITEKAKQNFQKLLLENAEIFYHFTSSGPSNVITQEDINKITEKLQDDLWYKTLDRLDQDRMLMLLHHLGFVHGPIREHCPASLKCMDTLVEKAIARKAHRPSSWQRNSHWLLDTENNQLNLVDYRDELVHGFVLVYSTKRKASLATLSAFSMNIPNIPIQILAVTDTGSANAFFSSDLSHQLITEGNAVADKLQAHFMTSSSTSQQKTAQIEKAFSLKDSDYSIGSRTPVPPPVPSRQESYHIRSGSLEDGGDSEGLYYSLFSVIQRDFIILYSV